MIALLAAAAAPPAAETLVGFGVAAPIVIVLLWLLHKATAERDTAQRALIDALRETLPVVRDAAAAMNATTAAITALTDEVRRKP